MRALRHNNRLARLYSASLLSEQWIGGFGLRNNLTLLLNWNLRKQCVANLKSHNRNPKKQAYRQLSDFLYAAATARYNRRETDQQNK